MVTAMDILGDPDVRDAVDAHAMAWFPRECCGLLVTGPAGHAALLTPNGIDEAPGHQGRTAETGYVLDSAEIARSAGRGETLVGIFHSHCRVGATFSDADRRLALSPSNEPWFPGVDYVVLDAQDRGVAGFKVFRWAEDRRDFIEP